MKLAYLLYIYVKCFYQVIQTESAEVEKTSVIVAADEAVANESASQAQALKDDCEAQLAEAIPALELAIAGGCLSELLNILQNLSPANLH